jgi:hypothetical protein
MKYHSLSSKFRQAGHYCTVGADYIGALFIYLGHAAAAAPGSNEKMLPKYGPPVPPQNASQ